MSDYFHALDADKQRRIRDAALGEFGRYGYAKTSAEQVARAAGIGKGMLFRYFGSKAGLFEYLVDYMDGCLRRWFGGLEGTFDGLDFIERYRRATRLKLQAYTEEPRVFEFFTMLLTAPENLEAAPRAREVYEGAMGMRAAVLAGIQGGGTRYFRGDIDGEKAKRYIVWLIDGYARQLMAALRSRPLADMELDGYWVEFDDMLDDMKKLFYKQPEGEG